MQGAGDCPEGIAPTKNPLAKFARQELPYPRGPWLVVGGACLPCDAARMDNISDWLDQPLNAPWARLGPGICLPHHSRPSYQKASEVTAGLWYLLDLYHLYWRQR